MASVSPLPALNFSSRIYALLLYAYPTTFREAYGYQMTLTFRDLCRDAYRQGRTLGLLWLWISTLADLGITALEERLAPHGGPRNIIHRFGIGLAAGMVGGVVAGLAARLAMRGVSLAGGLTPGFTFEGTFVILAIGLTLGTPFGLAFMLVRSLIPGEGLWKGLTYGVLLFVVFIAPPFLFYREGEALLATPLVTVTLFAPVALAYGLAVQFTALRLEQRPILRGQLSATGATSTWAQVVWLIIFACLLELAVLGTTSILNHLPRIPIGIVRQMQTVHLPFAIVRDLNIWLINLIALGYFGLSTLMFWGRNRSPMARFTGITLLLFGGALFNTGAGYYATLTHDVALIETAFRVLQVAGATCLLSLLYVFPDGRLVVKWTQALAVAWVVWAVVWAASPVALPEAVTLTILSLFLITGVAAQVQRYRQFATLEQRQQSRAVVIGFLGAVAGFVIVVAVLLIIPDLRITKVTGLSITATFSLYMLPWLLIPVTIGWAMRRHKLWST